MEASSLFIRSLTIGESANGKVVYGHGWARDHHDFIPVAESIAPLAHSVILDFPGFGETPRPETAWDTREYANAVAAFIKERFDQPVIWVGHSFGARVGLRLARQYSELLRGMVLAGAAGIPRKKCLIDRLRGAYRGRLFRWRKAGAKSEIELDALERQFGSADYVRSKELGLRDIFLRTISEDQSAELPNIMVPTSLIYGSNDTETPPEMGQRMSSMMPNATYLELDGLDHISVLDRGRHIIAREIKKFLKEGAQ